MPDSTEQNFTPVPVAPRADGWTAERQRLFIRTLSETACVADACDAVAMSRRSAYRLRARPDAFGFADAWDQALRLGAQPRFKQQRVAATARREDLAALGKVVEEGISIQRSGHVG